VYYAQRGRKEFATIPWSDSMNPLRMFLRMISSPSLGERIVAMAFAALIVLVLMVGFIYAYHYYERKNKRRLRRRRRRMENERRELTHEDVEGDVW
jgi:hypothetical protein